MNQQLPSTLYFYYNDHLFVFILKISMFYKEIKEKKEFFILHGCTREKQEVVKFKIK